MQLILCLNLVFQNCYAAVLSYCLQKDDSYVIILHPKCVYEKFELRLSNEIDKNNFLSMVLVLTISNKPEDDLLTSQRDNIFYKS